MRIFHVSAEATPFVKVGGLGDVCGILPAQLAKRGHDVRLALPGYRKLRHLPFTSRGAIAVAGWDFEVRELVTAQVPTYLLDCPALFDRAEIYGENGWGYGDNALRFSAFAFAAAQLAERLDVDVVHLHDWQAAPAAAVLHKQRVVLTLHNVAYQEFTSTDTLRRFDLDASLLTREVFGQWDGVNLLQGGINCADAVTTVSPTHAKEIVTPEGGFGMDSVLRKVHPVGILNGLDLDEWNPARQPALPFPFDVNMLASKRQNKQAFMTEQGFAPQRWNMPLVVAVSRIVQQKGFDLVADTLPAVLATRSFNFVVMGTGEPRLMERMHALQREFPDAVRVLEMFDTPTAHRVIAAGDFLIIPSLFEPCGLTQMQAQRYGTLPIVRRTGGLADTVIDAVNPHGTGFCFDSPTGGAFAEAIYRALNMHALEPTLLVAMRERGMRGDFSWESRAREYEQVYAQILAAPRRVQLPPAPKWGHVTHSPQAAAHAVYAIAPEPTRAYFHFQSPEKGTVAVYDETAGHEVLRQAAQAPRGDGFWRTQPGHAYRVTLVSDAGTKHTRFDAPLPRGASGPSS